MPDSFGARLRERRERQQVALSAIAEQTKIKVSLLEALERDDVSHWPSGIFRRAFIRAYAHAIGLEPDVVLREFLEVHPDPIEVISTVSEVINDGGRPGDGAPTRLRYLVASAIGSMSRLRVRAGQRSDPVRDDRPGSDNPVEALPWTEPAVSAFHVESLPSVDHDAVSADTSPLEAADAPELADAPEIGPAEALMGRAEIEKVPPTVPDSPQPDLLAVAQLCTELARVQTSGDVPPLLKDVATLLDAVGLIVWVWDPIASELRPALTHGYSEKVVAQLPRVERDSNNATAAAFRAAQTCVVNGDDVASGALAVPLMAPGGCAGVLAIELTDRREDEDSVLALATIFAAQLATLIGTAQPVEASDRWLA